MAPAIRSKACASAWPVLIRYASTLASLQMRRCTSACLLISREKITTRRSASTAALRAMLRANEVFPTDGLAARMISSPGWRPCVTASSRL